MFSLMVLLYIIASCSFYFGAVSYAALLLIVIINLVSTKLSPIRYFFILSVVGFLLINFLRLGTYSGIDLTAFNFSLQLIMLCSLDLKKRRDINIIYTSLSLQVAFSLLFGLWGYISNNFIMLVDAGQAKGIAGFYALRGLYSTPQILASISLLLIVSSVMFDIKSRRNQIVLVMSIISLLLSLNRVNILVLCILISIFMMMRVRHKIILLIFISPILTILALSIDSTNNFMNIATLGSRILLINGVISTIDMTSITDIMLGNFKSFSFYLPEYLINVSYVENGLLSLFKYFGLLGLLAYVSGAVFLILKLAKNKLYIISMYAFCYFFLVQNMTHEFVHIIFPLICSIFIYFTKHQNLRSNSNS
jgi:hypothetical protein